LKDTRFVFFFGDIKESIAFFTTCDHF